MLSSDNLFKSDKNETLLLCSLSAQDNKGQGNDDNT